jgi:hypothetical protein
MAFYRAIFLRGRQKLYVVLNTRKSRLVHGVFRHLTRFNNVKCVSLIMVICLDYVPLQ